MRLVRTPWFSMDTTLHQSFTTLLLYNNTSAFTSRAYPTVSLKSFEILFNRVSSILLASSPSFLPVRNSNNLFSLGNQIIFSHHILQVFIQCCSLYRWLRRCIDFATPLVLLLKFNFLLYVKKSTAPYSATFHITIFCVVPFYSPKPFSLSYS